MTTRRSLPHWTLLRHPIHFLTLGLGSGLSPWAPGTVGTLVAWFLWPLLAHQMASATLLGWLVAATLFGFWACGITARALGAKDPGAIVWDEMVATWWVLFFLPPTLAAQSAGVLLFRCFDVAKPWPIAAVEAKLSGGLGIMVDDLAAAALTLFVLAVASHYHLLPVG